MRTLQKIWMSFLLIYVLAISGCGGSNSLENDTRTSSVDPTGIWLGYQEVHDRTSSGLFDMKTIVSDGRFYGISEDADIMYAGTYVTGGGKYMVSNGSEGSDTEYKMYGIYDDGHPFARGIATLTIDEKTSMQGVFENEALQEGTITSHYSKLTGREASLTYLAGSISQGQLSFTIDGTGNMGGNKGSCDLSGTIFVAQSNVNIYDVHYTLSGSNCSKIGSYQGLGIVALDESESAYFLALSVNSEHTRMDRISYFLADTPEEFLAASSSPTSNNFTVALAAADKGEAQAAETSEAQASSNTSTIINFSGAWWPDGTRCGAVSFNGCSERTYDSGLSYDELESASNGLRTSAETLSQSLQSAAQNGTNFFSGTW